MNFKIVIQFLLSFLTIFLIVIFYKTYFNKNDKNLNLSNQSNNDLNTEISKNNLVKDITYKKIYNNTNDVFEIKAAYGEYTNENSKIIKITDVSAFIYKNDGTIVYITSDSAKYNTETNDTNFVNNVKLTYLDHKIYSEFLDIFFSKNLIQAYKNLRYQNLEYKLVADKMDFDLITKNTNIYMFDQSKVKIRKNWMALIKKFRIKSFKNSKSVIELKDISLSYKNRLILNKINFKINKGQILGLLGPNGVGKSTVFNIITGLLKPSHGKILMDNKDITNYSIAERSTKFNIGYVPQYDGYFHDLTLEENLYAIAEIVIREKKNISTKVENLISQFEFENITNIKAKFLSGGQKKKLVIALSLISDPKVLLLDEPFAALDVLTIKMLKELIVNLQTYNNISICLCDHQARDLLSCVDVAIILSNCKIIASGTPSQLISDGNAQAAYFGDSFKLN